MNDPQTTYAWLKVYQPELPYTLGVLVERIHTEAGTGEYSSALQDLSAVKKSVQGVYGLIQAIVYLECALAECKMHLPNLAVEDLWRAVHILEPAGYSSTIYQHYCALAYWMLGNLSLPSTDPSYTVEATYGKSLSIFRFLALHLITPIVDKSWYRDRIKQMQQAIPESIRKNDREWNLPKSALLSPQQKTIDILREIPSGGFGPDGAGPSLLGQLQLSPSMLEFQILGKIHYLYNLRGADPTMTIDSDQKYYILQVRGDSMRKAGINPGDCVLLRYQNFACNGDIVAAEVAGVERRASLKSFITENGKEVLIAQNDSPDYNREGQDGQIFYIRGVILGVFKTPAGSGSAPSVAEPEVLAQAGHTNLKEQAKNTPSSILKLPAYPIYAEIPAGGPKTSPVPTGEQIELDRLWINGDSYCVFNLRNLGRVINPRGAEVIILKVVGCSMDRANIVEGDYILLRRQAVAEPGDIVAAEIQGVDHCATLKRYLVRPGKVVLSPESTDPKYTPMEFSIPEPGSDQQPFYIRGIALAVLKPCSLEPSIEKTVQKPKSAAR